MLWVGRSFVRSPCLALSDAEDLSDVGPTAPGSAQPLDFLVDERVELTTLPNELVKLPRTDSRWEPCPCVEESDAQSTVVLRPRRNSPIGDRLRPFLD